MKHPALTGVHASWFCWEQFESARKMQAWDEATDWFNAARTIEVAMGLDRVQISLEATRELLAFHFPEVPR